MTKDSSSSRRPLYDVLGVPLDSDTPSITRAYRRLALRYHPDRNNGDPECTEMFKKIGEAYTVLSNDTQRRIYDRTGQLPTGGSANDAEVSTAQRSVEVEDQLRDFFTQYRDSPEEKEDFLKQFRETNGNFKKMIFERLLFDNSFPEQEVERLYRLGEQEYMAATAAGRSLLSSSRTSSLWETTTTPELRKKYIQRLKREKREAELQLQELLNEEQDGSREEEEEDHQEKKKKKKRDRKEEDGKGETDASSAEARKKGESTKDRGSKTKGSSENTGSLGALQVMMRQRQRAQWDAMVSQMDEKYVHKKGTHEKKSTKETEGTKRKRTRSERG